MQQQRALKGDPEFWDFVRRHNRSRGFYDMYEPERRDLYCNLVGALAHGRPVPDYSCADKNTNVCAELNAFKGWVPVQLLAARWLVSWECLLAIAGSERFRVSPSRWWIKAVDVPDGERCSWEARVLQGIRTGADVPAHRYLSDLLWRNWESGIRGGVYAAPPEGWTFFKGS